MDNLKNTLNFFFRNRYTRNEYFSVYHGFEKGFEDKTFFEELEKQWDGIKTDDPLGFDEKLIWNKVIKQVEINSLPSKRTASIWHLIQRAAAILFLPLLMTSLFYFYTVNKKADKKAWALINCPAGTRTEFQLPDGSTGFLNSKSTLKYPVDFENNRDVYLTGEAFFEVVKNKKSRFRVTTRKLKAEVLGTTFNIMAYDDQSNEEITLKNGSLKVLSKSNKQLSTLVPNQQFVLDKAQNHFIRREVNVINYTSWVTGKLIIQNERFEDVAKKLSRWYDVQIEVEGSELKYFRYYATFENEPLDEVLKLIKITAPIQFREEKRVRHKDGSFSKRRIKFELDEDRTNDFK